MQIHITFVNACMQGRPNQSIFGRMFSVLRQSYTMLTCISGLIVQKRFRRLYFWTIIAVKANFSRHNGNYIFQATFNRNIFSFTLKYRIRVPALLLIPDQNFQWYAIFFTKYDSNPFKLTCKRVAMYGRMIICNFPVFRPVISRNLSSFESGFLLQYSHYLRYAYLILQSIHLLSLSKGPAIVRTQSEVKYSLKVGVSTLKSQLEWVPGWLKIRRITVNSKSNFGFLFKKTDTDCSV